MAKAGKVVRKKGQNGYTMPSPIPTGEILTDLLKQTWRLGTSIGKGGFGEIYSAQDASKPSSKYPYVVKIEPHGNGPLFVEIHIYMKVAKAADIENFKSKHKLKSLGMPRFIGSGSHEVNSEKFRFLVMEKFGSDVDKLLLDNGGKFPVATCFQLAWQMVWVLQYMHQFGYVHADLKGANMLMGDSPETRHQAYLVDFGLTSKFTTENVFKPNPKMAHDGTIEYLSRDAHHGVSTRRGDLEILAYNMVYWLGGTLPWISKLKDKKLVHKGKEDAMNDISKFLIKSLGPDSAPDGLSKFFNYVNSLKFNEEPDYKKIRNIFKAEIEKVGASIEGPLEFNYRSNSKRKSPRKIPPTDKRVKMNKRRKGNREISDNEDNDSENEIISSSPVSKRSMQVDDDAKSTQTKLTGFSRRIKNQRKVKEELSQDESDCEPLVKTKRHDASKRSNRNIDNEDKNKSNATMNEIMNKKGKSKKKTISIDEEAPNNRQLRNKTPRNVREESSDDEYEYEPPVKSKRNGISKKNIDENQDGNVPNAAMQEIINKKDKGKEQTVNENGEVFTQAMKEVLKKKQSKNKVGKSYEDLVQDNQEILEVKKKMNTRRRQI